MKKLSIIHRIRFRLILAFLVPVICILFLGFATYEKASTSLVENYKESTKQTVDMLKQYISLVVNSERDQFKTYANDANVKLYFSKNQSAEDAGATKKTIKDKLTSQMALDSKLNSVFMLSDDDYSIYIGNTKLDPNLLTQYKATFQGTIVSSDEYSWMVFGQDAESDAVLGLNTSTYSVRIARVLNRNCIMLININSDIIRQTLETLDPGEGGYVSLITSDGVEYYSNTNIPKSSIGDTSFFQNTLSSDTEQGSMIVAFDGTEYLYLYSKLDSGNAYVVALVPQSRILEEATDIKNISFIFTLIAVIIALLLGTIISSQMSGTINYIIKQLKKVASGNLTVNLVTKRKDEFGLLCNSVNETVANVKDMIIKVSHVGDELNASADYVKSASDTFVDTSKGIQNMIVKIGDDMNRLDSGSENCLSQMDMLSGNINSVSLNAEQISKLAKDTGTVVTNGESSISGLSQSADATKKITNNVIDSIKELNDKTKSIGAIVDVINGIAEQTNLLSLNASIEAARAGESGRGFAVVAEEIRHLADQSQSSAGEISNIIVEITRKTQDVVDTAGEASKAVESQSSAIDNMKLSFSEINEKVTELLDSLSLILDNTNAMNYSRNQTLNAIEEITNVSNETSQNSSIVNESAQKQYIAGEELENAASELRSRAESLVTILGTFEV